MLALLALLFACVFFVSFKWPPFHQFLLSGHHDFAEFWLQNPDADGDEGDGDDDVDDGSHLELKQAHRLNQLLVLEES